MIPFVEKPEENTCPEEHLYIDWVCNYFKFLISQFIQSVIAKQKNNIGNRLFENHMSYKNDQICWVPQIET